MFEDQQLLAARLRAIEEFSQNMSAFLQRQMAREVVDDPVQETVIAEPPDFQKC